jgi:predicted enzyme related to lactoylglutathione lyase
VGESVVCGIGPERPADGPPASWLSYVAVEDVDSAAAKARDLGAGVPIEPGDVGEAGRMAVIEDPQGAIFSVWQARDRIGADLVNDNGALTWNELATTDADGAKGFYGALFEWRFLTSPEGPPGGYSVIRRGERSNGGIRGMSPMEEGVTPYWLPYFVVPSAPAFAVRVGELGGTVIAGPFDVPAGKMVAARDPQGAAFAVFAGDHFDE